MIRTPTLARSIAVLAFALELFAPRTLPASDGAWLEIAPPGRSWFSGIYDPVRQRMIVAGGRYSDNTAGVWTLSLDSSLTWTFVPTSGRGFVPNPGGAGDSGWNLDGCAAIYDPVRDRMLLEGADFSGPTGEAVYALSLSTMTWSKLATAGTPPPGRWGHTAIYDPAGDRMITYGGAPGLYCDPSSSDVWVLSLAGTPTWALVQPTGPAPIAREYHGAIYDPPRARMVIFGGRTTSSGDCMYTSLNDVWALSLGGTMSWTQLQPSGTPPAPTYGMGLVYDLARDRMLKTGGTTWSLDLATLQWQQLPTSGAGGWLSIYDPINDRVIAYSGSSTRELRLSQALSWRQIGPISNYGPGPFYDPALCFDAARARVLESYGGAYNTDYYPAAYSDLIYGYGLQDSVWRQVDNSVPYGSRPHARIDHSAIVDPARGNMIVFGGYADFGSVYNDLWSLKLAPPVAWTKVTTAGTPPSPRGGHSTIYDPGGDRMLLFGGANAASMNDLWALALGAPQWLPLAPAGIPPSPRQNAAAVYDPAGNRMLLFGGFPGPPLTHSGPAYNDLWALSLSGAPTWVQLSPTGTPPPPAHDPIAIYDPDRNRVEVLTDAGVWALGLGNPPSWQRLDIENSVFGGIERGAAVYDPVNHRVLLFPRISTAMWELKFADTPALAVGDPLPARGLALRGAVPNPPVGPVTIAFSLAGDGPARLALYDIAGREVAVRDVGAFGAGSHAVDLAPGGTLSPGVYLVRLSAAGRALTRRVAIVR